MAFRERYVCIVVLLMMFIAFLAYNLIFNNNTEKSIKKVISPVEFVFNDDNIFIITDLETLDADYTEKNNIIANKLGITEDEAFIAGHLAKYWAKKLVEGRKTVIKNNDLVYYRFGYKTHFKNSAFCIQNDKPTNKYAFNKQLKSIRGGNYVILDLDTEKIYPVSKNSRNKVKNYIVLRKNHLKNIYNNKNNPMQNFIPKNLPVNLTKANYIYQSENFKIIVSDLTTKLKPDRNCSSEICKEILQNINTAQKSIDIAIYGYSSTPLLEEAIKKANERGVKIRLVYDIDSKGNNIYPDTSKILAIIPNNKNDKTSAQVKNTMHNKFYIFDNSIVITGSANLSHTDMSGFNSNSIIVIKFPEISKFYTEEFEQMYRGKYHSDKISIPNKKYKNIQVFFSPQDKAIKNGILPLIKNAKKYIYIPAFVITEPRITTELITAKKRGVDIKIITDALNASTRHSKHKELRNAEIPVKAENYAGKMHSKSIIIDDEFLVIGSMNFSNNGENNNDENLIILQNSEATKFYKNFFLYQWNKIPDKWLKFTPRAEGQDSIGSCSDGIDNNYDGKTDGEDEACKKLK